jgi:hypothetical protein
LLPSTNQILVSKFTSLASAVAPPKAISVTSRSVIGTAYWVSWVCFGVWGFRFDPYYVVNAWWMVLGIFWFTVNWVYPVHALADRLHKVRMAVAVVVAGMLIYGTYGWLSEILDGWHIVQQGHWLRVASLPLQTVAASTITALAIVPLFRRGLGPRAPWLLSLAALPVGFILFGRSLISAPHWHDLPLSNAIKLFDTCILPLIIAAVSYRWPLAQLPRSLGATPIAGMWRGQVSVKYAFGNFYWPIVFLFFGQYALAQQLSGSHYTEWKRDTLITGVRILYLIALAIGSLIGWRSVEHNSPDGSSHTRVRKILIVFVSALLAWLTVGSREFAIGRILTDSTKTALGSAYEFRILYPGTDLQVSGDVLYGLSDRLAEELAAHPEVRRLRLRSDGGMVDEARAAAKIVSVHNLDTVVGDECSSACTIIFMAGRTRILEPKGRLGFHAARTPDPFAIQAPILGEIYASFGIEPRFVAHVEAVKPPDLWYPTRAELIAARVLL